MGDLDKTYPNINLIENFKSAGFNTYSINGHNMDEIHNLFTKLIKNKGDKPNMIYANTIKGKGIDFMEKSHLWHNRMPTKEQINNSIEELQKLILK